MTNPKSTEYQNFKRLLFSLKKYSDRITIKDANSMIQDSCEDAYNNMEGIDRKHVRDAKDILVATIKDMGDKSALELLAAIGDHLNGCEEV